DTIEKNIEGCTSFNTELDVSGEKQAFEASASSREPIDIVTFDYSDSFMIRSKYLDELEKTEKYQIKLNIRDITKSEVDSHIFRECMNVLENGWNLDFLGIKKEEFLTLIWLLYDLRCYTESDALFILYKNLLSLLLIYLSNSTLPGELNLFYADFMNHNKYFLPFIFILYDNIYVKYDSKTKELSLIEEKKKMMYTSFEEQDIDEIIIRTTPIVLELINKENSKDKLVLLNFIACSYRIRGIKISNKDMYYTERKDLNHACKIMKENSIIEKMNTSYVQVFTTTEITESDDIISIEFENIVISSSDNDFLIDRKNLESLILIRCNIPDTNFLRQLSSYFSKLRNLYIVGFIFNNKFFRYLHVMKIECLDIPFCKYKGNPAGLNPQKHEKLKELRENYTQINYKILNSIMLCNALEVLHIRGFSSVRFIHFEDCKNWQKTFRSLDLSFCQINSVYMDFFCTDIKAENLCLDQFYKIDCFKKILNQKSLHTSTKKLTLSNNLMSEDIFSYLAAFEVLEYLNLSFLKCNSVNFLNSDYKFKSKLLYLDLSGNGLQKTNFSFINQFDYLSRLDLSDCKLKCEFMSYLTNSFLIASLKVINLSGNILCSSDISRVCLLENLIHLVITLDNKVFSEFLKEYGVLECLSLETIVLINTNVNADIKKFIISQPSLKNVRLRGCMTEPNYLTMNSNVSPDFFKTIVC
ncbi:hypothetical protein CWI38_1316p0010, partial [Hamiltosporidium tvaerminnensis]